MKLKPYPSYKDSGVEWLGDVPEGWDVKPLLSVARERKEPNTGMHESNLLSLSYGNIVTKDIESNDGLLPESFETYQVIHDGDIVFRLTDLQNDKRSLRTALVKEKGIITSAYVAASPNGIGSKFLNYLLRSYDTQKVFYSMGGGLRQSMKYSDIKRLPILIPEIQLQRQITTFLDRETTKLDTLISKQEKLIELLQEKRQAMISHAVTNGLEPDVKMKVSGVEWLGLIPMCWSAACIKWFTRIYSGGTPDKSNDSYWADGTVPWLNSGSVNDDIITVPSNYITEEAFERSSAKWIPKNALVIALAGQGKTKGMVAQLAIDTTCNQSMAAIIPTSKIRSRFLFWWLKANYQNIRNLAGGDLRDGLNLEMIGGIYTPIPPFTDQDKVTEFLDRETTKIDTLIDKAKRSIELAKEHRTALISAAVTGKIDVREYA